MSDSDKLFVLGSDDPEMSAIEEFLASRGIPYGYALKGDERVRGSNAYSAMFMEFSNAKHWQKTYLFFVECWISDLYQEHNVFRVDHHNDGDPGYGLPPKDYWKASSLGQVISIIDKRYDPTPVDRMIAAADHCLLAAYRDQCPGVNPEQLGLWRAASRAAYRGVHTDTVHKEIMDAFDRLTKAPKITLGDSDVSDLREYGGFIPELKEAACRFGIPYITKAVALNSSGCKVILGAASPETVSAFLAGEGPAKDLVNIYGDPARGLAGGFLANDK